MKKKKDRIFCKSYKISQNSVIPFINRQTSPCTIKTEKKTNLNQIVEDTAIAGGALPCFFRYSIILSICSGSIIKDTILISDPHFLQIRGFIPYTLFIRRAHADLFALPFTSCLSTSTSLSFILF